ncbi:hypothetical protein B5C34_05135 [Pacificimonas flava]|uniref:Glycosyltransferase 2-like domain-containing protein n=2 Tax=Pacificimonas TaxID=1960290 RepID=A0A219B3I8_9SPHN|nr:MULTISPECIES: glycosyltransferase [Pacificimonas]MBZ6377398.1 glycosyltransferase [Pacificimonas aurantium]OWV32895.1 hypothetical protein B5C34_05135 [Pacificimonas flava]
MNRYILVPAWDEAEVIGPMLRHLTATLAGERFDVFVGVYPNDPQTRSAAAAVPDGRVRIVTVDNPGPTTKADCLNGLWREMVASEATLGAPYKGIVLHDAEDVVHRDELAIFDHLLPRKTMVQLPVVPILDNGPQWVGGTYADEFAENHGKNLIVREFLGAALPSAGVACCFERGAIGDVAASRKGAPFDPASLTEDYELGIRISRRGKGAFVRLPSANGGEAVSTREHFPADFDAALKQRTRWLVGIAYQGWDRLRWDGSLADKYMFLRDRKALASAPVILFAYLGLALGVLCMSLREVVPEFSHFPPIAEQGSLLLGLLTITSVALVWRTAIRVAFTWSQHGAVQGLLSIPRSVVSNAISMATAARAAGIWMQLIIRRKPLVWHKTRHRFPADDALCGP